MVGLNLAGFVAASFLAVASGPHLFSVEQPNCEFADLTFVTPDGDTKPRCHAGWLVYQEPCYKAERTTNCPPETFFKIPEYQACAHENFGPAGYRTEQVAGGHYFPGLMNAGITEASFRAQKQREADEDLARRRASNPKYKFATVRLIIDAHQDGHVWYERFFERVVENWNVGVGEGCPVIGEHNGEPKTYEMCRHIAHGEASPLECGYPLLYAPQMTMEDLRSAFPGAATDLASTLQAPVCVSCEHLPMTKPSEVVAKFDCLMLAKVSLGLRATMTPAELQTARSEIHKQLLLLHEFAGDQMVDGQNLMFRSLYKDMPAHDPGCGVQYRAATQNPDGIGALKSPLYACRRLLLPHVPKDVLLQEFDYCQDIIAKAAGQSPSLSNEERAGLLWLSRAMSAAGLQ